MELKPETPKTDPQPTSPSPPPDGAQTPSAGKDSKTVRVIDSRENAGWQSHKTPETEVKKVGGKHWYARAIIIGPIAMLLVIGLGAASIFLLRKPAVKKAIQATTGVNLQSVGADQLGKVNSGNLGKPNETLTISANTNLKGAVTIGDTLTVQGATTSKGIINALGGLNISGAVTFDSITSRGGLNVAGSSNLQGDVNISNLLTVRNALNVIGSGNIGGGLSIGGSLTVGGAITAGRLEVNNFIASGIITVGHIVSTGETPTVTNFPGAGISLSRVAGNDTAGTVVIETNTGLNATQLVTVNFRKTFGTVPKVILTPVGPFSARLQYYTSKTPQGFTINTNTASPPGANTYAYDYIVVE